MSHLRPGSSSSLDTHSPVASSSRTPYPVPTTNKSTGSSSASPPTTTSYRPKRNRWSTVEGLGTDHSRSTESGILGIGDAPFTLQGLSMRARAEIRGPGGHKDQRNTLNSCVSLLSDTSKNGRRKTQKLGEGTRTRTFIYVTLTGYLRIPHPPSPSQSSTPGSGRYGRHDC